MSQNYLTLQAKSQRELLNTSVGTTEIFEKAWTLAFGNSFIELIQDREIESRFFSKGTFNIFLKIERSKYDNTKILSRYIRLSDRSITDSIFLDEDVIKRNLKYSKKKQLIATLLSIFEDNRDTIKKIKMMQRKLLLEINKFHESNKKNDSIVIAED